MTTITQFLPRKRREWYEDIDGRLVTEKRYDERRVYKFDLTEWLDASETISSVTWTMDGPTNNADSYSGAVLALDITGTGEAEAVVTTSASRKLELAVRWRSTDQPADDYS